MKKRKIKETKVEEEAYLSKGELKLDTLGKKWEVSHKRMKKSRRNENLEANPWAPVSHRNPR